MKSPRLPSELTDRIIDFSHNNKRTLSNCALTHSSWLAASRFHLFHTITTTGILERETRVTRLESIIRKRSSILPYIKTVKIRTLGSPDQFARLRAAADLTHAIHRFRDHERLPAPSVHATVRGSLGYDYASFLWSFSLVSGIVTHVKLSNVTFGHPDDIWSFLPSFPRLQYLELQGVGFNNSAESTYPSEEVFSGIPLSAIRVATASMGFVIGGLVIAASSLSHLEEFGIAYQDVRQGTLPQLADAIQRRVKCLRFTADCYPGPERGNEWRPPAFDMGKQTNPTPITRKLTGLMTDRNPGVCWAVSVTHRPRPRQPQSGP